MTSNDTRYVRIRESLKRNPAVRTSTIREAWDLVETDGYYALPAAIDGLLTAAADRCDTIVVKSGSFRVHAWVSSTQILPFSGA